MTRAAPRKGKKIACAVVFWLAQSGAAAATDLLAAGDPFPAWAAPDHDGRTVSSSDYAGRRYLLWFYPKALTPG